MATTYTYGQGTAITVANTGPSSSTIFVYNYDVNNNAIIPINGQSYVTVGGGASTDIVLPALTASNQSTYNSTGLYFSQSRLQNSLEVGRPPDIGNPSVDGNIPFTEFEYAYFQPDAPFVRGGLNPDFTAVDGYSYPLQWSVTDPNANSGNGQTFTWGLGGSAQYNGQGASLSAIDLLRAWMAATPFTNPKTGTNTPQTTTDNLIWQDSSALNNNRIVGPSKLWTYASGGSASLPSAFPANYTTFITQYPYDGKQLAAAGAFGSKGASSPLNNSGWQVETPIQKGGTGIDNGYTYSMQQTATQLGGITSGVVKFQEVNGIYQQILPNQGAGGFQGFYTYPQENILGGITYLADQVTTTINVGPLSSSTTIGTGDQDRIIGTIGSDVISGGHNGDRLTGQPVKSDNALGDASARLDLKSSDVYLYLRTDSSLHGKGLRDVITDFHENDTFDLSAIDANNKKRGNQTFTWIGTDSFRGKAGQLRIDYSSSGKAFLQGDTDANGKVDFEVKMLGVTSFGASNLLLQ